MKSLSIIVASLLFFCLCGFLGLGSKIDEAKDTLLGKSLSNYQYALDKEWSEIKDNGIVVGVMFKARYDTSVLIESIFLGHINNFANQKIFFKDIVDKLNKYDEFIQITAIFPLENGKFSLPKVIIAPKGQGTVGFLPIPEEAYAGIFIKNEPINIKYIDLSPGKFKSYLELFIYDKFLTDKTFCRTLEYLDDEYGSSLTIENYKQTPLFFATIKGFEISENGKKLIVNIDFSFTERIKDLKNFDKRVLEYIENKIQNRSFHYLLPHSLVNINDFKLIKKIPAKLEVYSPTPEGFLAGERVLSAPISAQLKFDIVSWIPFEIEHLFFEYWIDGNGIGRTLPKFLEDIYFKSNKRVQFTPGTYYSDNKEHYIKLSESIRDAADLNSIDFNKGDMDTDMGKCYSWKRSLNDLQFSCSPETPDLDKAHATLLSTDEFVLNGSKYTLDKSTSPLYFSYNNDKLKGFMRITQKKTTQSYAYDPVRGYEYRAEIRTGDGRFDGCHTSLSCNKNGDGFVCEGHPNRFKFQGDNLIIQNISDNEVEITYVNPIEEMRLCPAGGLLGTYTRVILPVDSKDTKTLPKTSVQDKVIKSFNSGNYEQAANSEICSSSGTQYGRYFLKQ